MIFSVENTIRQMVKEMKKYLNTLKHLDAGDQQLTTNLSSCSLVHINDEFRRIVEDYHSVTTQLIHFSLLYFRNQCLKSYQIFLFLKRHF